MFYIKNQQITFAVMDIYMSFKKMKNSILSINGKF